MNVSCHSGCKLISGSSIKMTLSLVIWLAIEQTSNNNERSPELASLSVKLSFVPIFRNVMLDTSDMFNSSERINDDRRLSSSSLLVL